MPLYQEGKKSQEETDFEIQLLAMEIKELENSKRNEEIFQKVQIKEQNDLQQFLIFKRNLQSDLKAYLWPYGTASILGGIVIVRSLVFGSLFGLVGGKCAKSLYQKFYTPKNS